MAPLPLALRAPAFAAPETSSSGCLLLLSGGSNPKGELQEAAPTVWRVAELEKQPLAHSVRLLRTGVRSKKGEKASLALLYSPPASLPPPSRLGLGAAKQGAVCSLLYK